MKHFYRRVPRAALSAAVASGWWAFAGAPATAITQSAATITGTITDGRNLPVVGAVITARGASIEWTATLPDGSFVLRVLPGAYDILVRKGGFSPGTASVVVANGPKRLSLVLSDANLDSVNVGSASTHTGVPFNAGPSATATLANASTRSARMSPHATSRLNCPALISRIQAPASPIPASPFAAASSKRASRSTVTP